MRPGVLGVAVGLVVAVACALPSTDEFSGGPRDGGPGTSGPLGTSGMPEAAASSSGDASSGSSSGSASSSGTSGATDAPLFVCPDAALVCDDFEGAAPAAPLATQGSPVGTKLVAGGHDSGHAASMTFQNGKSTMLEAGLGEHPHVVMSFWFRVAAKPNADPGVNFRIASLLFGDGCDWELSWAPALNGDGLHGGISAYNKDVNTQCGPVDYKDALLLPAAEVYDGKWHHVTVDADSTSKIRRTSATVDGRAPVVLEVDPGTGRASTSVQVDIGMPCVQESSGCYDWAGDPYTITFDQLTVQSR